MGSLCWPAHLAQEGDDTAVPPTPAFIQVWERKLVNRNMDPYRAREINSPMLISGSPFSINSQENQRRMISIGSKWLLQYS